MSRLVAIVRSSDDAIYSKDANAILTSWNPAAERLYGYTAEEAIGQPVAMLIPPHRKNEEIDILGRIMRGERVEHYETERLTKDGRIVRVSLTASPVYDGDGNTVGVSVIARDISERLRLEAAERDLERREFLARAAHELKAPVTTIAGLTELLRDHRDMPEEQRDQILEAVGRQGQTLRLLVQDLMDLTYVESGRLRMEIGEVDVAAAVSDAVAGAPPPAEVTLKTDVAQGLVVAADHHRLTQVLVNLLSNAYRYGGPLVEVAARRSGERIVLSVTDNGEGVPREVVPVMFEPFTRGHTSSGGTGLGLSIALRLVQAFGGDIRHEAVDPHGACFVVTLPSG